MAIVQEYLELTKKYKLEYGEKTIVLYQVGTFYEVYALLNEDGTYYGSDIEFIAKMNDMAIAQKNSIVAGKQVVMAGVGVAYVDKYIQRIQEYGYTIVIYKQDIDKKNTTRSLSEIISPGTYFPMECDNDIEHLSNNIMCIWLHKTASSKRNPLVQVILGIANIDIFTGRTSIFQFCADYLHSPTTYDQLERYISAYKPSECLFVANMPEKLVDDIIGFVGLENTKINKIAMGSTNQVNAEKQVYQKEIFKRFYPNLLFEELFAEYYIATQSFCFLLDFVWQHNPNLVSKLSEPVFENYTDKLVLANHSLKQLNIIDDSRHTGKLRSVSNFLNNCMTGGGKRRFLHTLHYPTTDKHVLKASYAITEHLLSGKKKATPWPTLRSSLSSISDLEKFSRKMVNKKVVPKNLLTLLEDLKVIRQLYEDTKDDEVLQQAVKASSIKQNCTKIIDDISATFNLEECRHCMDISESSLIINRGVSSTLDELVRNSLDGRDKLEAICAFFSDLVKSSLDTDKEAKYVKLHETARSDAILIATTRRITLLKDALKKSKKTSALLTYSSKYSLQQETFTLDLSSLEYDTSGGGKNDVVITSQSIRTISSQNEENKFKMIKEMQLIFQKYCLDFAQFDEPMQDIITYVTEMDLLQNKCFIAHKYNYCKPEICIDNAAKSSFLSFTGIRHPLIEHLQTEELYVTNDLTLGGAPPHPPLGEISPVTVSDVVTSPYFSLAQADTAKEGAHSPSMGGSGAGGLTFQGATLPTMRGAGLAGLSLEGGAWGGTPQGVLLYGTNAVGKTSFIKSVGIAVIMAQAGLYVPCTSFLFKPYQTIFTRILGNDNLFKGLSTFAVEMTELRSILVGADKNSLVLGDELCSGTESDSALSIFTAGLETLHEKNSTFLFATHFHEINQYDEIKALHRLKMMHMAVHYNKETDALVYDRKLRDGPGESMYGLEVCKSLHLPDAFLKRAHEIRMKYYAGEQSILTLSPTHFNARKLVGNCELCKTNKASEVHHLQHQKNALKTNDYIDTFHKNHVANLLNICEECHHKIHKSGEQHKVVKTTRGYELRGLPPFI
jgi:DNA mismatch repair protein MutS